VGLWLSALAVGCERAEQPRSAAAPPSARSETVQGPVALTVEVTPSRTRLSDEPRMTLTVAHQPGVEIEMPEFDGELGDFLVRDFREALPEAEGDRQIRRRFYTLEPTRAGTLQVEPIVVAFTDTRREADPRRQIVESRPLPIQVTTSIDTDSPSLDQLEGYAWPTPPASRHSSGLAAWWYAAGTVTVALLALAAWRLFRRREDDSPPPTPREIALLELDRLWRAEVHYSDVKQYYARLTGIVRQYIERTSGVRAPEQTTEEFLRAIGEGRHRLAWGREALRDFLESADLVKFAGHQPDESDVRASYDRARDFVGHELPASADDQEPRGE
jgi:hypothetical protein